MNNEEKTSEHVPVSISELSKRGYQLLKEDHIAEAEENFRRILEVEPQNNYALVGMGDAARKRKSYHEAIRYYEECLGYHVGNKYALVGLADSYRSLKQFHRAIEIWEKYLAQGDSDVTVLTRI
ncbi:MAG TPA: tetratricopeptide repeat protein, partial [Rectinemataceae bacterium]|nr:tetratricopeptide repeat protein [Rectinemataceae bacterium]